MMNRRIVVTDRGRRLAVAGAVVMAMTVAAVVSQAKSPDSKGGIDETGPYTVVDNWFKPLHPGRQQCVLGVYAESADRVYVVSEVEVPSTPAVGNCTAERSVPGAHSHFILVLNRNGEVIEDWSQWNGLFGMPHTVKMNPFDPEKHVWIVNRDNHQIHEFTHDGKQLVLTLGEKGVPGDDASHFNLPADISFLPDGSFVVADGYGNSRVVKFDAHGKYLLAFGSNGSGPGQFKVPHSIAIDSQRRLYVADRDNQRVQVFDENGTFLDQWPNIRGIVFLFATQDRAVWAMTGTTNRLLKYDRDGHLQTYWGTANTQGIFPGSLYAPHGFSVDPEGSLYIADYRNHRVQKFVPSAGADRSRLIGQLAR
jgi:DNA-binding beta-propeller fold protein YncE